MIWEIKGIDTWQKNEKENNVTLYPQGKLVIWSDIDNKDIRLAYKFDIYSIEPLSRDFVFIDAQTGEFIDKEPIMFNSGVTGTLSTRYSGTLSTTTDSYGNNYRLHDPNRGNGIFTYDMNTGTNFSNALDFIDNDNNWTSGEWHNTQKDDAALDAHWALQKTYDYFHDEHNRNSYDNQNAAIRCYVHYKINWENAAWDGSRILIGDGASNFDALASIDVLAHEFGHAVCSYTCNLRYGYYESAALNEGLSDIWGICVENYSTSNKQTWLMGEDITIKQGYNCLRNIQNPKSTTALEGQHPDTYHGSYWDNGNEPHNNSTVLSHWFYLLAHGGSGTNDNGDSFNINGIGIEKAADIVYRMETQYLSSNSNYSDAKTFAIQAAEDIFGANTIETYTTINAWYAVGIGNKYYNIRITGTSTVCTSNSTFTLQNRPPNSTVSWTHSSNLTQVGGNTGTTYTVKAKNSWVNGAGWGKANVNGTIFTKTFWVGKPKFTIEGEEQVGIRMPGIAMIDYSNGGGRSTNVIWTRSGAIVTVNGGPVTGKFRAGSRPGMGAVYATVTNSCGSKENRLLIQVTGGWYSIYPNPAGNEIYINLDRSKMPENFTSQKFTIKLYDKMMTLKKQKSFMSENTNINVSDLKEGVYILQIISGKETFEEKIIISR
jgi:Zn-dependent metalloprotease